MCISINKLYYISLLKISQLYFYIKFIIPILLDFGRIYFSLRKKLQHKGPTRVFILRLLGSREDTGQNIWQDRTCVPLFKLTLVQLSSTLEYFVSKCIKSVVNVSSLTNYTSNSFLNNPPILCLLCVLLTYFKRQRGLI